MYLVLVQLVRNLNLKDSNLKRKFKAWFKKHWEILYLGESELMNIKTSVWIESLEEAYQAGYKSGQRQTTKQSKDTVNK